MPEPLSFADDDREWVRLKWATIRDHHQKADRAAAKWRKVSAEINDYLDRTGITDVVQRARIRKESLALKDAVDDVQWFRAEANAHSHDLNLYLKLKEMGLL